MADRIVVNTGPLIAIGRVGALELLARLPFEFVAPMQVREELQRGDMAGHILLFELAGCVMDDALQPMPPPPE